MQAAILFIGIIMVITIAVIFFGLWETDQKSNHRLPICLEQKLFLMI